MHVRRPCKIILSEKVPLRFGGMNPLRINSSFTGSRSSLKPRRPERRMTWVSTGSPGASKATERITFAVFLPTPGKVTRSESVSGTSPENRSSTSRAIPMRLLAFALKNPVAWINSSTAAGSAPAKARGVGNEAKRAGVTAFTRISVHCADRMVAASN